MKRVMPLLWLMALGVASSAGQTPTDFYDDSVIQDLYLDIHPKDWATLQQNYLDNNYYPADFRWRNILVAEVGVRSRGRGSRSPVKPNLKIDFDRFELSQKFLGLKSTTLKANNQDASMVRERVAMMLYERMGIPTPRETYARLYVNGQFFGLYNLIETIDKDFLRRVFNEEDGYLYEWKPKAEDPGYRFEYLGPDPAAYSPVHFDPITHEKDPDPAPLVEMVRAINESPSGEFLNAVSMYLDPRQFVVFLATETYLADYDGFLGDPFGMNNFHVYRFAGTRRHIFLPWDKDGTFSHPQRDIMQGVARNALARKLLDIPEYRSLYLDTLVQAAVIAGGSGGWMEESILRFYRQMADVARRDPNKQCSPGGAPQACGAAEFEADIAYVLSFAGARQIHVIQQAYGLGYFSTVEHR